MIYNAQVLEHLHPFNLPVGNEMVWTGKPYRLVLGRLETIFSEKYRTGMSQGPCGSQRIPDRL